MTTPHHGRHRRQRRPVRRRWTCSSTARRSPRCSRRARPRSARPAASADTVIDATGKYVDPGRGRLPHAHGAAVRRHVRLGHVRDRHDARRPGAAPRRSSTSPCSAPASACRTAWPPGTPRPTATARSTTGSTRSSAASTTTRSRRWTSWSTEGITASSCSAYRGSSTPTTARSCGRCRRRADNGALIMMHAENGIAIDVLVAQALARGETDPILPRPHPAVGDRGGGDAPGDHAGRLTGAPLYVVHMSAKQARRHGRRAHATTGWNVFGETCPQYLYLSLEEQLGARRASRARSGCARRRCAREPRGTRTTCGQACAPTTCRSSAPTTARSASRSRRSSGIGDFSKIPNGIGSVEHRMDLMYQGVVDGRISARALGRADARRRRPGCSGCTAARA